jgi:hypothetical protein
MIDNGVDVFRLNFSHGTLNEHAGLLDKFKAARAQHYHTTVVMGDLCGPKIRTGRIQPEGQELQIDDEVDLAVIIVPGEIVPTVLEQAGEKQVKGAIVITAGFKETGEHGLALERQLKEIADKHNISLVGPNCLGVINNNENVRMNASFATKMAKAGNIAFISQSGALCTAVLDYAEGEGCVVADSRILLTNPGESSRAVESCDSEPVLSKSFT